MNSSENSNVWRRLVALESVDHVSAWHLTLHGRELSLSRAREIQAAAKQSREFFFNAFRSDLSVRPLLTFYGVASLSRALLLCLRRNTGEMSLVAGHGIESCEWRNLLSGDISGALGNIGNLRIKLTNGLFTEFLRETKNEMCLHVHSSVVDARIEYPVPEFGTELEFLEILSKIPDLSREMVAAGYPREQAFIHSATSIGNKNLYFLSPSDIDNVGKLYFPEGFSLGEEVHGNTALEQIRDAPDSLHPQVMHSYQHALFGSIPSLYLVAPLDGKVRLSQLAFTYLLSYYLGMLTRYFPTQWVALSQGSRGDRMWPTISAAQNYVEEVFPLLVSEFLFDTVEKKITPN